MHGSWEFVTSSLRNFLAVAIPLYYYSDAEIHFCITVIIIIFQQQSPKDINFIMNKVYMYAKSLFRDHQCAMAESTMEGMAITHAHI